MDTQATAREIDARFDALLYDGMPLFEFETVEQQRQAAHDKLTRDYIAQLSGGGQKLTR